MMVQIECSRENLKKVTWTDYCQGLKPGNLIQFKNEDVLWRIDKVYNIKKDKQSLYKTWNVGGVNAHRNT